MNDMVQLPNGASMTAGGAAALPDIVGGAGGALVQDPLTGEWVTPQQLATRQEIARLHKGLSAPVGISGPGGGVSAASTPVMGPSPLAGDTQSTFNGPSGAKGKPKLEPFDSIGPDNVMHAKDADLVKAGPSNQHALPELHRRFFSGSGIEPPSINEILAGSVPGPVPGSFPTVGPMPLDSPTGVFQLEGQAPIYADLRAPAGTPTYVPPDLADGANGRNPVYSDPVLSEAQKRHIRILTSNADSNARTPEDKARVAQMRLGAEEDALRAPRAAEMDRVRGDMDSRRNKIKGTRGLDPNVVLTEAGKDRRAAAAAKVRQDIAEGRAKIEDVKAWYQEQRLFIDEQVANGRLTAEQARGLQRDTEQTINIWKSIGTNAAALGDTAGVAEANKGLKGVGAKIGPKEAPKSGATTDLSSIKALWKKTFGEDRKPTPEEWVAFVRDNGGG